MKINNQKGMSLAVVLLAMAVLAILGTSILRTSLAETKQVAYQDKKMQAYYLARSGADTTSTYILREPQKASDLIAAPQSSPNSHFSNGTFAVDVNAVPSTSDLIVEATGTVDGVSSKIEVLMTRLSAQMIIDKAIYSNKPLNITGMNIEGDVQSGGNIGAKTSPVNSEHYYDGTAEPNSLRYIGLHPFPDNDDKSDLIVKNSVMEINSSGDYSKITIGQKGKLKIVTGGSGSVIQIVVDILTIDNILEIDASSGGRVELYIKSNMVVTTKGTINNTEPKNMVIYLYSDEHTSSKLEIQANMVLNGYIIGPGATVEIQSTQSTINGAVIADIVVKNATGSPPNGDVNFVPLPDGFSFGDSIIEYRIVEWKK